MPDLTLPKEFGALLPKFNGDKTKLNSFLNACDSYINQFLNEEAIVKIYCLNVIKSKLTGNAEAELQTSDVPNNWNNIKTFLIDKFGDHANLDVLKNQLQFLRKRPQDDILSFIEQVKHLKIRVNYRIDADVMNAQMKLLHKELVNDLAKNVLISNCPMELQTSLLTTENLNFDRATQIVENYVSQKSQLDMMRSWKIPSSNSIAPTALNETPFKPIYNKQIKSQSSSTPQVFAKIEHSSQSNSTNVFKPNPSYTPQHRSIPMSVSTHNHQTQKRPASSSIRRPNKFLTTKPPNVFSNNNQQPNFVSEELTNVDNVPSEDYYKFDEETYQEYDQNGDYENPTSDPIVKEEEENFRECSPQLPLT